ncbi:LysM peptidoglycan-binding domain-containing protein [Bradyrhizobium sp. CCGUVB1N3]|uniref:LysM peptidoglycan-binding domain-containing protein n=1 Tax=Bradyrhizobium sp. CCGUVB1N3 TaxID=2949629 RepID=UPI0020B17EC7|nr:LysM peptidoglycan-binding domain-containing protein [Bradyrhizobium sp. CCGUVB1N3]MCP3474813.1 LysM peptidoglycan-binding domain-containing protein [Bradyrhizobium sp. CCGUVB1N3]
MVIASKATIAVCSFLLVAAGGAAIVVGTGGLWQAVRGGPEVKVADGKAKVEAKPEAKTALAAPSAPSVAPSAAPSNDIATALGKAQTALADLPAPTAPPPATSEETGPRFDVARVDDDGEAVIAGRAAPGARVELLRDGESHASAVADASGLFVMTPPKLPPGSYKLSLQSTAPDGSVAKSRTDVPVTLNAMAQPPRATAARTDVAKVAKETPAKETSAKDDSSAAPPSTAQSVLALAAAPPVERGPLRSKAETTGSITASRIVIRGDSLWQISRRAYGDGLSYALIYNANRDKIHNPDRIYPGQTFVLPRKAR